MFFVRVRIRRGVSVSQIARSQASGGTRPTGPRRDRPVVSVGAVRFLKKWRVYQVPGAVTCAVRLRETWRDKCDHDSKTNYHFFHKPLLFHREVTLPLPFCSMVEFHATGNQRTRIKNKRGPALAEPFLVAVL